MWRRALALADGDTKGLTQIGRARPDPLRRCFGKGVNARLQGLGASSPQICTSRKRVAPAAAAPGPQPCHGGVRVLSREGTRGPRKCRPRGLLEQREVLPLRSPVSRPGGVSAPGRGLPAVELNACSWGLRRLERDAGTWSPASDRRCDFAVCAVVSLLCVWGSSEVAVPGGRAVLLRPRRVHVSSCHQGRLSVIGAQQLWLHHLFRWVVE